MKHQKVSFVTPGKQTPIGFPGGREAQRCITSCTKPSGQRFPTPFLHGSSVTDVKISVTAPMNLRPQPSPLTTEGKSKAPRSPPRCAKRTITASRTLTPQPSPRLDSTDHRLGDHPSRNPRGVQDLNSSLLATKIYLGALSNPHCRARRVYMPTSCNPAQDSPLTPTITQIGWRRSLSG